MRREVWFQVVSHKGEEKAGPTRAYDLPDNSLVDRLRYAVNTQCPNTTASCDAANLRVYKDITSRRNKQPLDPRSPLADIEGETTLIVELPPPPLEQSGVIRKRFKEWFASDMLLSAPERIKLDDADENIDDDDDDDEDDHDRHSNSIRASTETKDQNEIPAAQQIKYFDMADFPPLVNSADRFKRIMLIKAQLEVVRSLPPFDLVLNCEECYFLYEADQQAFRFLEQEEISMLSFQKNVLRLIDGSSNNLKHWRGVSVLFSSSKDATKCRDCCPIFVLPAWTLEELKECNALLPDDLMLQEEELEARFYKYGGIVRSIFAKDQEGEDALQLSAIGSFDALTVVKYAQTHRVVTEEDEIHRVLKMVPCSDSFRDGSNLAFVSDYVGKRLIDKAEGDDLAKLSAFAVT
ncbi:hypothetical protein GN958_ATG13018 [Phytophthora infestans]|uniref:Crinkler (CRN) family protein n=1 Tax=Phytophthora infestans TaxID=4787 RepID=A0A8S9U9H4_PHYIN|nr:hypothetical protein GN958_ATG13018 [Phytophthora infestans]